MIEYDGGFAEWEIASAEREHAAAVRASEAEALQRMHERKRVARDSGQARASRHGVRNASRLAQRELELAETAVLDLEERVASLTRALEDPALYTKPQGVSDARELGIELESTKNKLDAALERWSRASEQVDSLAATEPDSPVAGKNGG
jgi:hypothetical protein